MHLLQFVTHFLPKKWAKMTLSVTWKIIIIIISIAKGTHLATHAHWCHQPRKCWVLLSSEIRVKVLIEVCTWTRVTVRCVGNVWWKEWEVNYSLDLLLISLETCDHSRPKFNSQCTGNSFNQQVNTHWHMHKVTFNCKRFTVDKAERHEETFLKLGSRVKFYSLQSVWPNTHRSKYGAFH